MGETVKGGEGEADEVEQLFAPRTSARWGPDPMDDHRLGQHLLDAHPWIEGAERVLEDDLHAAAQGAQLVAGQVRDVLSVKADPATGGLDQPQCEPTQRGLARARLTDQTQGLTTADGEGHAVDCSYHPAGPAGVAGGPARQQRTVRSSTRRCT